MRTLRANPTTVCFLCLVLGCSSSLGEDGTLPADEEPSAGAQAGGEDNAEDPSASGDAQSGATSGNDPTDTPSDNMPEVSATDEQQTDTGPTPAEEACGTRTLPTEPLRRLSSYEYSNTVRDLLGEELNSRIREDWRFPETLIAHGFSTSAEANIVNTSESNAIEDNAAQVAAVIDQDPEAFLRGLLPCELPDTIADADIDACVDPFIDSFGKRAYRRPLTESETALARSVYDSVRADNTASFAWAGLVQYFFQAPALLYRVERGAVDDQQHLVPLTDYERASRLSYFLTASMPDDALLKAADAGELGSASQVRAQAERLMQQSGFDEIAERFHTEWLELHNIESKPEEDFPGFEAARGSINRETAEFVRWVINDGDGSIASLLSSSRFPVNSLTAEFYGVDAAGASEAQWVPVEVPGRRGILTQAALMATLAGSTETKPIHRGGFMQTQVLCQALPALPGGVDIQTPLQSTSDLPTARQRLAPLLQRGDCSGCHTQINPVGLAFENYDAVGRWRDEENGTVIDASGSLELDGQVVEFTNAAELAGAIANSQTAQQCYTLNWFKMALGRTDFAEDACSLQPLYAAAQDSGGDIREMILALVETDAFLYTVRPE